LKNLKLEITNDQLKSVFQQFGNVTSCAVREWTSKTGKKKAAYGFVAYATPGDATNAMNDALANQDVKNLFLPGETIYIQRHQSKDKRHQFLVSERRKRQMTMQQNFGMGMGMPQYPFAGYPMAPQNFRRTQPMYMNNPMGAGPNRGPRQQPQGPFQKTQQQHRGPRGMQGPGGMHQQHRGQQRGQQQQQPRQQKPVEMKPVSAVVTAAQLKSRIEELLKLDHDKQRQILGEMLFPKIQQVTPDLAPKITGMLIDLDVQEVIELLEDQALLNERIEEAKELLAQSAP
jgi:polyadenylate-binding protein